MSFLNRYMAIPVWAMGIFISYYFCRDAIADIFDTMIDVLHIVLNDIASADESSQKYILFGLFILIWVVVAFFFYHGEEKK